MKYNENSNKRVLRYKKKNQKSLSISYKRDFYEEQILPAIKKSGLPVAAFVKMAIEEKIQRDHLQL